MNLSRLPIPGLFITATDTGVGKTIIAGAIARWLKQNGRRVAVLKPVATGCAHVREGLVSEDAEFLAAASDTHHPLDLICPNRYEDALAPSVAARRVKRPLDWDAVARSIRIMSADSDAMIIEGVGGLLAPLDDRTTVRDMLVSLGTPALIVARPGLGTINHTLLTIESLRSVDVRIAGVIINRYPTDSVGIAEETNPREIERLGAVPILAVVPEEKIHLPLIPAGIISAIGQVDWESQLG